MRTLTITRQNCLSHCSLSPWQSYVRFSDIINDIKRVFTISIFLYLATVQPSVTTNQNAKTYLFFAKALLNVNSVMPGFNIAHSLISWKLPTIGLSLDVQKVVNTIQQIIDWSVGSARNAWFPITVSIQASCESVFVVIYFKKMY